MHLHGTPHPQPSSPSPQQRGLTSAERLKLYRRCFHDLDEQLLQLHTECTLSSEAELQMMQAEVQCLEELIMVFTDLLGNLPPLAGKGSGHSRKLILGTDQFVEPSLLTVDHLDLSLVTDMLMLSATSPWTVFVADRAQWQICYVSPSVKKTFGWTPEKLIGTSAWDNCHPDDVPILQRMFDSKENASLSSAICLLYRRMRKDRSYISVQSTGRPVGTRWFTWVEQDASNLSMPMQASAQLNEGVDLPFTLPQKPAGSAGLLNMAANRLRKSSDGRLTLESTDLGVRPWNASNPSSPAVGDHHTNKLVYQSPVADTSGAAPFAGSDMSRKGKPIQENETGVPTKPKVQSVPQTLPSAASEPSAPSKPKVASVPQTLPSAASEPSAPSKPKVPSVPQTLPSAASEPPGMSTTGNAPDKLTGKKVLLVEDDRVNRTVAQRLLQNKKCNVTVACNGEEALEILQSSPTVSIEQLSDGKELPAQFDLVLMDVSMPVMNGTEAVELFRDWESDQDPPRKRMVIFALTANTSDRDMIKCAQSGFDEFVDKPLTVEKLLARIAKHEKKK